MNRRRLLAVLGAAALPGCGETSEPTPRRTHSEPTARPTRDTDAGRGFARRLTVVPAAPMTLRVRLLDPDGSEVLDETYERSRWQRIEYEAVFATTYADAQGYTVAVTSNRSDAVWNTSLHRCQALTVQVQESGNVTIEQVIWDVYLRCS